MVTEIWKPVPGFEGQYEVSDMGRVRSVERYVERLNRWGTTTRQLYPGRMLTPILINSGYLSYHLYDQGHRKPMLGHWIVALAFGIPGEGPEINHKDTDKTNNQRSNLHWCTRKENVAHAKAHGLSHDSRKAVVASPVLPGVGFWFPSMASADEFLTGKRTGIVSWAVKHQRAAHGFHWGAI